MLRIISRLVTYILAWNELSNGTNEFLVEMFKCKSVRIQLICFFQWLFLFIFNLMKWDRLSKWLVDYLQQPDFRKKF